MPVSQQYWRSCFSCMLHTPSHVKRPTSLRFAIVVFQWQYSYSVQKHCCLQHHGHLLVLRLKAALVLLFHRGPHVISSVGRMGTLLFLAECHKSWLSQGFIVLRCLSYGKFLCLCHGKPSVPEASCFWLCLSVNAFVSLCIPQTLLTPCLGNQWREFHTVLVTDGFVDVLIRFWGQTVKVTAGSDSKYWVNTMSP